MTETAVSTSGYLSQAVAIICSADMIYFCPNPVMAEVA
jgi:hypothetical protein